MTSSANLLSGPLWLAGCGNMAGAMLARWLEQGLDPSGVTVLRPTGAFVSQGVRVVTAWPEDEVPALVLLGMKPHQLDAVAGTLAPILAPDTILVSILAGVELASLRTRFSAPRAIVRAMPNLPLRIGKGVVGLCGAHGEPEARAAVARLMAPLGHVEWLDDERMLDVLTALSGSGPAFVYRFIQALADGAAALGLPPEAALRFANATVAGAAVAAERDEASPAELAARVTSKGGTTQAGLEVLDADLGALVARTLAAAHRRGRELAAAARGPAD